mmetsp:Transcript_35249/g.101528  ORF Transcript_35249/g.101528 Transcript_35249/m.101528 type:complete len:215 (+) Transcript_35249:2634-3278(+)
MHHVAAVHHRRHAGAIRQHRGRRRARHGRRGGGRRGGDRGACDALLEDAVAADARDVPKAREVVAHPRVDQVLERTVADFFERCDVRRGEHRRAGRPDLVLDLDDVGEAPGECGPILQARAHVLHAGRALEAGDAHRRRRDPPASDRVVAEGAPVCDARQQHPALDPRGQGPGRCSRARRRRGRRRRRRVCRGGDRRCNAGQCRRLGWSRGGRH